MIEAEAYAQLRQWAGRNNLDPASVGGDGWTATALDDLWVLTPPGRSNTVYVVAKDEVRPVHPSRESLSDAVASMARPKGSDRPDGRFG